MDLYQRVFQVNVFGGIAMTKAFLPLLTKGQGRVVNVTSVAGFMAAPGLSAYVASKFAFEGFSDSIRREVGSFCFGFLLRVACAPALIPVLAAQLAPWGVKVSCIEPGTALNCLASRALADRPPVAACVLLWSRLHVDSTGDGGAAAAEAAVGQPGRVGARALGRGILCQGEIAPAECCLRFDSSLVTRALVVVLYVAVPQERRRHCGQLGEPHEGCASDAARHWEHQAPDPVRSCSVFCTSVGC